MKVAQEDITRLLKELRSVVYHFGTHEGTTKPELLKKLSKKVIDNPRLLIEYHSLLLFLLAYPENKNQLDIANEELKRVTSLSKILFEGNNSRKKLQLMNSGVAYTALIVSFSFDLTKWLKEKFTKAVTLYSIDGDKENVERVLCSCITPSEKDLIADKMLSPLQMIRRLKTSSQNDLEFLIQIFNDTTLPSNERDILWDSLKLFVRWELKESDPSLSAGRSIERNFFYHTKTLLKRIDGKKEIYDKGIKPYHFNREEKKLLVTTGRGVLAMMLRETDPLTYAEEEDVELFDMGRGIDIALYPMIPSRRLPLESYIGYVAFKNTIPVAYGGSWIFLHRAKTGINIFPAFRGGESSYLFSQILRLYHHEYNVLKFLVEPYQYGRNNPDGIKSGAYWFYYHLGFRSLSDDLRRIADREALKISADKVYRSPATILKLFTKSNLELNLLDTRNFPDADPYQISQKVIQFINARFQGNRSEAIDWALSTIFSLLTIPDFFSWHPDEIKFFNDLVLPVLVTNDIKSYNKKDRSNLIRLLRSKGKNEKEFVYLSQRYSQFFT